MVKMETPAKLSKTDRDALQLAIDLTRADPFRTDAINWKLANNGWWETAQFCAYHQQCESLSLNSEVTPSDVIDADEMLAGPTDIPWLYGAHEAARLVKQMQALGVSKYHPSPLDAIAEAEKKRR